MKKIWEKGMVGVIKPSKKSKKMVLTISESHRAQITSSCEEAVGVLLGEVAYEEGENTCAKQAEVISNELASQAKTNEGESVTYVQEQAVYSAAAIFELEKSVEGTTQLKKELGDEVKRLQNAASFFQGTNHRSHRTLHQHQEVLLPLTFYIGCETQYYYNYCISNRPKVLHTWTCSACKDNERGGKGNKQVQ
ncbi:hypothetical protein BDQ17DRAFT_1338642 [Cyathus striatus]|nr:hypothetical protein BDQ17DRAFT_1338642 [Cyathus striatus]